MKLHTGYLDSREKIELLAVQRKDIECMFGCRRCIMTRPNLSELDISFILAACPGSHNVCEAK